MTRLVSTLGPRYLHVCGEAVLWQDEFQSLVFARGREGPWPIADRVLVGY
jgi:hypothetical protein